MALQERINPLSVLASADLSASQFCFVTLNGSGQLALPSAGGDAIGVLQDKPDAAGRVGLVGLLEGSGRLKVVAGATLTPGQKVQSDASGHAIVAATGDRELGTVLVGGASGELVEIQPGSRMLLP
jgi:hypothetical protein